MESFANYVLLNKIMNAKQTCRFLLPLGFCIRFSQVTLQCQRLLFKAAKSGKLDTVQKLV